MEHRERPRRRTYNEPGHAHELTFTCYRRYRFLDAERTCTWLAEAVESARSRLNFAVWAFVFMPEHVHMIVWPKCPEYRVADILSAIKEPVGRRAVKYLGEHAPHWLPRITRPRGRRTERLFWQPGGGFDRNIVEPATLVTMIDYLHANPVRRGLAERPTDWRWSSASWWYEAANPCGVVPDRIPPEWLPQS